MPSERKREVARGVRDGQVSTAVRRARAAGRRRRRRVLQHAVVAPCQLHRHRRGALHQPVGTRFPSGVPPACAAARALPAIGLHAYTATATERVRQRHRRATRPARPAELVGSFDRPNLVYRVLARSTLKAQILDVLERHRGEAGIIYCSSARKSTRWRSGCRTPAGARGRITPAWRTTSGIATRTRSSTKRSTWSSPRWRSAWASTIGRALRDPRRHAEVARALPAGVGRAGRDGLEAECVLIASGADFLKWRMMLEKNGELSDARRALLRDIERYAASVGCRHKRLVRYFGETFTKDDCGACDYCLGELETRRRGGHRGAQDPVVRRAGRPALRRRARHQRSARQRQRAGPLARPS